MHAEKSTKAVSTAELNKLYAATISHQLDTDSNFKLFAHRIINQMSYIQKQKEINAEWMELYNQISENGTADFSIAFSELSKNNEEGKTS